MFSKLPYRVRWQDLKDLFRRAGTVLRADVSLGPDNRSRGFGTVLLATAEDAGRAVDMFNGYCWQTRTLEVRLDRLDDGSVSGMGTGSGPAVGATVGAGGVPGFLGVNINGADGHASGSGTPVLPPPLSIPASSTITPRLDEGVAALSRLTVNVDAVSLSSPISTSRPGTAGGAPGATLSAGAMGGGQISRNLFVGNVSQIFCSLVLTR